MSDIQELWAEHAQGYTPEEYNVDLTMHAHGGFAVGDQVVTTQADDSRGIESGESGTLIGLYTQKPGQFTPNSYIGGVVAFPGFDPMTVPLDILGTDQDF